MHEKLPSFGTLVDHRGLYVQRLANPLQPFHRKRNPYLTVDWSTIDLSIFNSEDQRPAIFPPELGMFDPPGNQQTTPKMRFASRERGGIDFNIWDPNMAQTGGDGHWASRAIHAAASSHTRTPQLADGTRRGGRTGQPRHSPGWCGRTSLW